MENDLLASKMPSPDLPFDEWMRSLVRLWTGYGGCRAPEAPQDQSCPEPYDMSRENPYDVARRLFLFHPNGVAALFRDQGSHSGSISAGLARDSLIQDSIGGSALFYRFMRIIGGCGETIYRYRDNWYKEGHPLYPFPEELKAAIDLGRRTCLFRVALGRVDNESCKQIKFFGKLHALLAAHP